MTRRNVRWIGVFAAFALVIGAAVVISAPDRVQGRSPTRPAGAEPTLEDRPMGSGSDVAPHVTRIATLSSTVTAFASNPDGSEMLVGERSGLLWSLAREEFDGYMVPVLSQEPILDLSDRVSLEGEQGLFDVAIVAGGSRLLVSYSALDGALVLESFAYAPGATVDPSQGIRLVELPSRIPFHYGGGLAVGADGDVFMGVGDMGLALPTIPAPQDPALIVGGVLRISAESVGASPASRVASPEDQVARGLRNPWRISIDPATGDLWIGDVGNETIEQINRVPEPELHGVPLNFGWPYLEGSVQQYSSIPEGFYSEPAVLERVQEGDVCGMVGGHVYHGEMLPALEGRYVYGDLCSTQARSLSLGLNGRAADDTGAFEWPETIVGLGEGPTGELYGLGSAGAVFRVDPGWWSVPPFEQERSGSATGEELTAAPIDCNVIDALVPLTHLGSLAPDELRDSLDALLGTLEEAIPDLPVDLVDAAQTIHQAFAAINEELAQVAWDLSSPNLLGLRERMLRQTGEFTGFGDALGDFYASSCE